MTKRLLLFFAVLVLFVGGGFVVASKSQTPLLSPLAQIDDQVEKVKKKISPPIILDISKTKELVSLEQVPRYMVYNTDTGQVYYGKGLDTVFSPASFTKLLSAQVALDLVPIDQEITATAKSVDKVPTILGLKTDEVLSAGELLRAAIATSANDAAQTLADGAALANRLSPAQFMFLMNAKAKFLGMSKSNFANPDGLDDQNQYSTLLDLAQLVNNVEKNYPEILAAAKSDREDIEKTITHGRYYLPNWNGLLNVYPGVNGLKIAYTENAGYSTIVTATEGHHHFVAIVSGTDSYAERDLAAVSLLDAALIAESEKPKNITLYQLNKRYREWGDLARQIQAEIKALEDKETLL